MSHECHIVQIEDMKGGCRCDHSPRAHKIGAGHLAEGIFIIVAVVLLVFWRETSAIKNLAITFVAIVFEALPFMLLGSFAGGLVEAYISRERMTQVIPTGKRGVFIAAGLGFVFPICECAVVPIIRRLLGKGMSPSAAIAYLLAGPIANPIVLLSTATAYNFQWSPAFIRIILGYVIAVSTGLLLLRMFGAKLHSTMLRDNCSEDGKTPLCSCGEEHSCEMTHELHRREGGTRLWEALAHGASDFLDTGRFLIVGAFVAATVQTVFSREMLSVLADYPVIGIGSAMAMAVVLNLCSDADAFVAASFRSTWSFASQMAFMLLGPMLDIKLVFMYRSVFRSRFIMVLASTIIVLVFLAAFAIHNLFGDGWL
mgnify:CR=1 FL=1